MKLFVFLCLLSLIVVPSKCITSSYASSSFRGGWFEEDIKKMQQDVNQLKGSISVNKDKECIGRLDSSIGKMKEYLEERHKETVEKSERIENLLDSLTHVVEKVRKELDLLRGHYEKSEEQAPKGLPSNCVKDIKSHNFMAAAEKLHKITEIEQITSIVKDVYDHQPGNFELVLNFADSVGSQKKAFYIYKSLMSEMEHYDHADIFKTIRLIESMKKKMVHGSEEESDIQEDAEYSIFRMKNTIKIVAAEKLKAAMLNEDFKNVEIQKIADGIHDFNFELFEDMMRIVVSELYPKIGIHKVLENIKCFGHIEEYISSYLAVYDVIRESHEPNPIGLFPLAEHIKETLEMKGYLDVHPERKCIFEGLKYRLPKSVRNIVFLPKVCFKNVHLGEYLFAGGNHTEEKRFVYSWLPNEKDIKDIATWGTWIPSYEHGTFDIYNDYNREFLYADLAGFDEKRRFVFTWSGHKKKLPTSSRWIFVPEGDHVLIKNAEAPEFLYADFEQKHGSEKHHIFTLKTGKVLKESVWFAENCIELYHQ